MINAKPDAISLVVDFLAVIFFFLNSNPISFYSFFLNFPDKTISYYITFAKENKPQITNTGLEICIIDNTTLTKSGAERYSYDEIKKHAIVSCTIDLQ